MTKSQIEKVTTYLKQNGSCRRATLVNLLGFPTGKPNPFDLWAKKNLHSLGKGLGWSLTPIETGRPVIHTREVKPIVIGEVRKTVRKTRNRLSTEQKTSIATIAVNEVFLQTPKLPLNVAKMAATQTGVVNLPTNLVAVLTPVFEKLYQETLDGLLKEKPPEVIIERAEANLSELSTLSLFQEIFKRAPALAELLPMFVPSSSPFVRLQAVPDPISIPKTSNEPKAKKFKVLITGFLQRQVQDFLNRPKMQAVRSSGRVDLSFVVQDRHTNTFPASVDLVIMLNKRSHSMWTKMCTLYGTENVLEASGHHDMEEKILKGLK